MRQQNDRATLKRGGAIYRHGSCDSGNGASHGVGQATALILTAAGTDLVVIGHDVTALTHVAQDVRPQGERRWSWCVILPCPMPQPGLLPPHWSVSADWIPGQQRGSP